jgi:hypothetical protein
MKHGRIFSLAVCCTSLASLLILCTSALAATTAYWRFEQGPANGQMVHQSGVDGVWSADVPDSSGNGNALSVWTSDSWAGYAYRSDLPSSTIPQTGAANNYSVKNTGGLPSMWNNTLQGWTPSAWTIEASFKPETGGYRTIVGRDSQGAAAVDPNLSALYFQIVPGDAVAIKFADVSGIWHEAVSAAGAVQGFNFSSDPTGLTGHWYDMAAVSDGTLLSLYLNSGSGYNLVAQTDMAGSSANTTLTAGVGSGSDWTAGDFSVGRGLYGGGHTDRAYGFLDEVRLSDGALSTSQFLFSVPEPGTLTLGLLGGLPLFARRLARRS